MLAASQLLTSKAVIGQGADWQFFAFFPNLAPEISRCRHDERELHRFPRRPSQTNLRNIAQPAPSAPLRKAQQKDPPQAGSVEIRLVGDRENFRFLWFLCFAPRWSGSGLLPLGRRGPLRRRRRLRDLLHKLSSHLQMFARRRLGLLQQRLQILRGMLLEHFQCREHL